MGRLFWKFFFFIWLAQLSAIAAISTVFWFERQQDLARWQAWQAKHATGLPETPGDRGGRPPPYADSLVPPPPPGAEGGEPGRPPPDRLRPPPPHEGGRGGPRHPLPVVPLVATLLASLLFAALLAWYFSRPIKSLRRVFAAVTAGDLGARVGGEIRRQDELADLGRDFDRMAGQLQTLVDGQRRLLHDVSHEMRSPLARLQAAVGLLRQRPGSLEAMLERIEREGARIDQLVGELLTLSRLEAASDAEARTEIPLAEMLAEIGDDARFEAPRRNIELVVAEEAAASGSPELLRRAIENVVRNALAHTRDDAAIRIELATSGGKWAMVTVEDDGTGVPDEELEAIFQPFHRLADSAARSGNGLGLAIARRIIVMHGGSIRASNRPAGGLRVEIRLPLLSAG